MDKFDKRINEIYNDLLVSEKQTRSAVDHILKRAADHDEKPATSRMFDTGGKAAKKKAAEIDNTMMKIANQELETLKAVHKKQTQAAKEA